MLLQSLASLASYRNAFRSVRSRKPRATATWFETLEVRQLLATNPVAGAVTGSGTTLSQQDVFSANVQSSVVNGAIAYSGALSFQDKAAEKTFVATQITSVQITEIPPVVGPTTVNAYFSILGKAKLNGGTSDGYSFTASGSLPYPANAGSTGGLGFTVTGPNGFSYSTPWHPWDAGQTVSVSTMSRIATSMTLASTANPSVADQPTYFTATVTPGASNAGTPTGSVSFIVDSGTPVSVSLSEGKAVFGSSKLSVGTHTIKATYEGTTLFSGSQATLSQEVKKASTTTVLETSGSLITGPLTLKAKVSSVAPSYHYPSGTVSVYDNSTLVGTATLPANATSELVTISLPTGLGAGNHKLVARYNGDAGANVSYSTPITQTSTTLALVSTANPAVFEQPLYFSATVTPAAGFTGTLAGNVSFVVDGGSPVSVAITNGKAYLSKSNLSVGSHTVVATYEGATGLGGSKAYLTEVINKASSTTSLVTSGSLNSGPLTLKATVAIVAPSNHKPTGTVSFFDNSTVLGTIPLPGNATSQYVTLSLPSGLGTASHKLVAKYNGDVGTNVSYSTPITQTSTTLALASTANPAVFEQPLYFSATVTPAEGFTGTLAGNVSFVVDGGTPVSVAITNGKAYLSKSNLSVGSHTVVAKYEGTSALGGSKAYLTEVVNKASSTTSLVTSGSLNSGPLTLKATVAIVAPSNHKPTGTVSFFDNSTVLGTIPLPGNATSQYVTLSLPSGLGTASHKLVAKYNGDVGTNVSYSTPITQTATTLDLTSTANPAVYGQSLYFTATVTPGSGFTGTLTGNVSFVVDGGTPVSVAIASGKASIAKPGLSVGSHTVVATFEGSSAVGGSKDTLTQEIKQASTSTTLTWTGSLSVANGPVTLKATVASLAPSYSYPGGTVKFMDKTTVLATVTLPANATSQSVTFTLPNGITAAGEHKIYAVYSGNTNAKGSESTAVTFTRATTSGQTSANSNTVSSAPAVNGSTIAPTVTSATNSTSSGSTSSDSGNSSPRACPTTGSTSSAGLPDLDAAFAGLTSGLLD